MKATKTKSEKPPNDYSTNLVANLFDVVSHPYRIHILRNIDRNESLGAIAQMLGCEPPTLSGHVQKLLKNGLIRKRGRSYEITEDGRKILLKIPDFERIAFSIENKGERGALEQIGEIISSHKSPKIQKLKKAFDEAKGEIDGKTK